MYTQPALHRQGSKHAYCPFTKTYAIFGSQYDRRSLTRSVCGLLLYLYHPLTTLIPCRPPWVVASILTCLNAWHADKTGERFYHITGWWWFSNIGFIIALSTVSNAGRYVAMFLMAFGDAGP